MATRRTRTALYSEAARKRLGDAVGRAREAAGYQTTADLARATGRAPRALYALENAEPTVGQAVLQAVGRTLGGRLPGWNEDTPRTILEGGPIPPVAEALAESATGESPADEYEEQLILTLTEAEVEVDVIARAIRAHRARAKQKQSGVDIPRAGEMDTK